MPGRYQAVLPTTLSDGDNLPNYFVDANGRILTSNTMSTGDRASLDAAAGTYPNAVAYVPGTPRAVGKAVLADITTTGRYLLTFGNATQVSYNFPTVGMYLLPFGVTTVTAPGSGAAAGSFYALS